MVALAGLLGHIKVRPLSRVWRNLKRFVAGVKGSSVSEPALSAHRRDRRQHSRLPFKHLCSQLQLVLGLNENFLDLTGIDGPLDLTDRLFDFRRLVLVCGRV